MAFFIILLSQIASFFPNLFLNQYVFKTNGVSFKINYKVAPTHKPGKFLSVFLKVYLINLFAYFFPKKFSAPGFLIQNFNFFNEPHQGPYENERLELKIFQNCQN